MDIQSLIELCITVGYFAQRVTYVHTKDITGYLRPKQYLVQIAVVMMSTSNSSYTENVQS